MLWTYLVARILIAGTTVNRAWATHHGSLDETSGEAPVAGQQLSLLTVSRLAQRGWRAAHERPARGRRAHPPPVQPDPGEGPRRHGPSS
jgi:hypothetical protein